MGIYMLPHHLFAAGGALPTQEKKNLGNIRPNFPTAFLPPGRGGAEKNLGGIRKVSKPHRMIAQYPVPLPN